MTFFISEVQPAAESSHNYPVFALHKGHANCFLNMCFVCSLSCFTLLATWSQVSEFLTDWWSWNAIKILSYKIHNLTTYNISWKIIKCYHCAADTVGFTAITPCEQKSLKLPVINLVVSFPIQFPYRATIFWSVPTAWPSKGF